MSYETLRNDFAARLLSVLQDPDQLQAVLLALDAVSVGYEFRPVSTELIVSDGIPDCVRLYLASKSVENVKRGTLENYFLTLRLFFSTVRKPLDLITSADIRLFLNWYRQARGVLNSTLDHKRIILNSFFEWCIDEDMLRKNPCRHIRAIHCENPERLPMTSLELEKVRNSCRTLREKAIVDFLYSTAARVSEFCSLDRSSVNFADHTVRIEHGKGDKGRTTFLNAEAEVSLRAYLDSRNDDNPALFVSSRAPHARMTKKSVEKAISHIVSRCSLSVHVTPHIFRHTAASLALQRGMPIDQVQRFLGHARIQTTLRYAKSLALDLQLSHQRFVA